VKMFSRHKRYVSGRAKPGLEPSPDLFPAMAIFQLAAPDAN
jgi:hypothetical protein